jgi:integrase
VWRLSLLVETKEKPSLNRSAKDRRNELLRLLDGVLSIAHKKIHAGGNSDRAKQGWARVLVSAVSTYGGLLKDSDGEHTYVKLIRLLIRKGANILDPEDVKKVIAQQQSWKNGVKRMVVCAYDVLTKVLKITWTPPEYRQEDTLPFIPEEKELDALIIGARSRRMTAFLQTLKETFADPSEALGLRWIDLDSQNNTITINRPVRGHNARQLKVSSKLVALLNALPKTSERIFPTSYTNIAACFQQLKRKVAHNLQNPRILSISFTTFRHWGATMTYHYTKKILLVKQLLGHKRIENTMKYTHLVKFKDSDFEVETATTVDQAKELLKVGYDYIAEKNGIMLFRRPQRFGNLGVIGES